MEGGVAFGTFGIRHVESEPSILPLPTLPPTTRSEKQDKTDKLKAWGGGGKGVVTGAGGQLAVAACAQGGGAEHEAYRWWPSAWGWRQTPAG